VPKSAKSKAVSKTQPFPGERLRIDFVILADAAQVMGGKLYLLGGGWNLYHAQSYPVAAPFAVAIGVLVPWSETNRKHRFDFVIRASEGMELGRGGGEFEIGREVGIRAGMAQRVTLAINGQLGLQAPGTYEIVVTIPGDEERTTFEALPPQPIRRVLP
jgi:hypothetical protein